MVCAAWALKMTWWSGKAKPNSIARLDIWSSKFLIFKLPQHYLNRLMAIFEAPYLRNGARQTHNLNFSIYSYNFLIDWKISYETKTKAGGIIQLTHRQQGEVDDTRPPRLSLQMLSCHDNTGWAHYLSAGSHSAPDSLVPATPVIIHASQCIS